MTEAPLGFEPLFRTSPYLEALGPFYSREEEGGLVLGLRVAQQHCNARKTAHGGLLATLADIALGYAMAASRTDGALLTTASLTIDFAEPVALGSWLEARVDVQKVGSRLGFANAYLLAQSRRVARASGVFLRTPRQAS